jgi:beta-glucuronidase
VLWSVANETPVTPACVEFLKALVAKTHEQDPARLVTAALLVHTRGMTKIINTPLGDALDVIGFNEYIGWYEHKPEEADKIVWKIAYDKPLISEFGGGAKYGLHGDPDTRWTEEYQANLYRHQLLMLKGIRQLRGMSPWTVMDFLSPRRPLPGIQDYFNRKGLISERVKRRKLFISYRRHTRKARSARWSEGSSVRRNGGQTLPCGSDFGASSMACSMATSMLRSSALPVPAMSKAVP